MSFITGYKQPAGTKALELGIERAARYLSAQDKGNNIYRYNYYLQISSSSSVDAIRSQTSEESDSQFSAWSDGDQALLRRSCPLNVENGRPTFRRCLIPTPT